MKQEIRTFRAATMDEAMCVHRELGQEVVVLESKSIEARRMLPWLATYPQVEVTAQVAPVKKSGAPSREPSKSSTKGQQKLRTLAESKTVKVGPATLLAPIFELPVEPPDDEHANREQLVPPPVWVTPADRSTLSFAKTDPARQSETDDGKTTTDPRQSSTLVDQQHLTSLQTIVSRLERQARPTGFSDVPHEFFPHFLKLVEADVEDEIARDLISKLRLHPSTKAPKAVDSMLTALVEREMRCAPPINPQPGRREVVMAIGPTGVGKTTTLAKLAGHFHLREGLNVGLITVDTYRVGAIEQLQSYADILQIRLRAASNPDQLRAAIDELDDVDLILIDTAGRSPWDNPKLDELRDFVQASAADHVLLVLSVASNSTMFSRIADRFALASPTSLILTKLDEIQGHGALLSIARNVPIPVSYFTTGQDVPDQIEPAHPTRMAKLILGHDQIHQTDPAGTLR